MAKLNRETLWEQLIEISNTLVAIKDSSELLSYAMKLAVAQADADVGYIGLLNGAGTFSLFGIGGLIELPDVNNQNLHLVLAEAAKTRYPIFHQDTNPLLSERFVHGQMNGSSDPYICMPLIANGDVLGCLFLEKQNRDVNFSEAEIQILSFIATQTAVSLQNLQLKKSLAHEMAEKEQAENMVHRLRQAQDVLLESEATFVTIIEYAHDGVVILQDTTFKFANQAALNIFGYSANEIAALKFADIIAPETHDKTLTHYHLWLAGETPIADYEATLLDKSGTRKIVELSAERIQFRGEPAVMAVFRDITKRKISEIALNQSQERLSRFMDSATESFTIWDEEMYLVDANQITLKYLPSGTQKHEIIGTHFLDFFPKAHIDSYYQTYLDVIKTGKPIHINNVPAASELGSGIFDLRAFKVGQGMGLIITDITAQKQTEMQLHTLTRAVEQSKMIVMITDNEGRIEYVNPRFIEFTQYEAEEVIGKNPRFLSSGEMPNEVFEQLWLTIKSGNEWYGELLNQKKNGETYWQIGSMSPVKNSNGDITHFLAITEDITERKIFEETMRRQDRLAAVGQLAAGIAHDFNNILAIITLYSDMMLRSSGLSDKAKKYLQSILEQSKRAGDLIQQILDFSRQSTLKRIPLELSSVLTEMVKLLQRTLPENIDVSIQYESGSYPIQADLTRIQQVFMNLAVNARDALPDGGKLEFKLEKIREQNVTKALILVMMQIIGCVYRFQMMVWAYQKKYWLIFLSHFIQRKPQGKEPG